MLECASTACKSRGGKHLAHLVSHACRRGSCKCCVQRFCAEARSRLTLMRERSRTCAASAGSEAALRCRSPSAAAGRSARSRRPIGGRRKADTKSRKMRWHARGDAARACFDCETAMRQSGPMVALIYVAHEAGDRAPEGEGAEDRESVESQNSEQRLWAAHRPDLNAAFGSPQGPGQRPHYRGPFWLSVSCDSLTVCICRIGHVRGAQ